MLSPPPRGCDAQHMAQAVEAAAATDQQEAMRIAESQHALSDRDARGGTSHLSWNDTRHVLRVREQELMSPCETNIGKLAAKMDMSRTEASAREARLACELNSAPPPPSPLNIIIERLLFVSNRRVKQ